MSLAINMREFLEEQSPEQLKAMRLMIEEMYPNLKAVKLPKGTTKGVVKGIRNKKGNKGVARAAMRPLNSFMAFRAYYSPFFVNYQQKDISVFINRLWLSDFFKAKWAIVARTYSIIRDRVGKANAPLQTFLALACPKIGILEPTAYFTQMGWAFPSVEKELGRLFMPVQGSFEVATNLSAEDIVAFCEQNGYASGVNGKYRNIRYPMLY